jgi:hypothetical protein
MGGDDAVARQRRVRRPLPEEVRPRARLPQRRELRRGAGAGSGLSKEAGGIDQEKLAAAIRKLKLDTVYGRFEVDSSAIQVGYTSALLQWQKGKQVLVWPENLAQGQAVIPMPAWSSRQ